MQPTDQLLWAEALSFPLASLAAINAGETALHCDKRSLSVGPTVELATDFDTYAETLLSQCGITLEYVRSVRAQAWFGKAAHATSEIDLDVYISELAKTLLAVPEHEITLKQRSARPALDGRSGDLSDALAGSTVFWHRLGTKMSIDLILAARAAQMEDGLRFLRRDRVQLRSLNTTVNVPFADQHLHLWACMPFHILWGQALTEHVLKERHDAMVLRTAGGPFDMRPLLGLTGIARLMLARFLVECPASDKDANCPHHFAEYLAGIRIPGRHQVDCRGALALVQGGAKSWRRVLAWGQPHERATSRQHAKLRHAIACFSWDIRDAYGKPGPRSADDTSEPLDLLLPSLGEPAPPPEAGSAELQFLYFCLQYIALQSNRKHRDSLFEVTFWQMIRCKNLFYRRLVQQEGTPGLTFFDHCYRNIAPFRKQLKSRRIRLAEAHLNAHGRIGKLEFRVGPEDKIHDAKTVCKSDLKGYLDVLERKGDAAAGLGITVHFVKGWAPKDPKPPGRGVPYSYPEHGDTAVPQERGFRYQGFLRKVWREMEVLASLLVSTPSLSYFLRAIDVANRERTVPNWVLSHLFVEFRRRMRPSRTGASSTSFIPLRHTAHLGEEFEHPMTGMRHIYEGVRYFGYETGDRIGHGLALGLHLGEWSNKHASVNVPIEEYLDDLVWEWMLCKNEQLTTASEQWEIEMELMSVGRALYSEGVLCPIHRLPTAISPWTLCEAYERRFCVETLNALGILGYDADRDEYKATRVPLTILERERTEAIGILQCYLHCECLWNHAHLIGNWEVRIDDRYLLRAQRLQNYLQRLVGNKGIVVETCPSSNRLIGNLDWYDGHPVFQFAPPESAHGATVGFTVNADDPLTFNTTVEEELMHLHATMTDRKGVARGTADRWINERCLEAWRSSFVYHPREDFPARTPANKIHSLMSRVYQDLATKR